MTRRTNDPSVMIIVALQAVVLGAALGGVGGFFIGREYRDAQYQEALHDAMQAESSMSEAIERAMEQLQ